MNKINYLIYFDRSGEILITTTPRSWNRAFPHHLNDLDARPVAIKNYLIRNFGFEVKENDRAIICYNWSLNIPNSPEGVPFY